MAANYDIDYNDQRFTQVESDKNVALNDLENTYADMIDKSDSYYQAQIDASQKWADRQAQLQQEKTDFAIEKIEQQKAQAQKDYTKEQSGAYVDWQKQSNQYGANAEQMAAQGLAGSGYSESSQVSMYNTYQNRVATAREVYSQAVLNYNNSITEARLQNNSLLAEIAYNALQQQLELSLQGFQYKNQLILDKTNKKLEVDQMYYNRYQDVLQQINHENALAEQVRQFNENKALEQQKLQEQIRQFNQNYELQVKEYEEGIRQFNEEIARLKAQDAQENAYKIQQLELQKKELEEEKRQFDAKMAEEKRQYDSTLAYQKSQSAKSSSSGGSSSSKSSSSSSSIKKSSSSSGSSSVNKSRTSTGDNSEKTKSTNSSSKTIDMNSVLALGYGPISASRLNELVSQGLVEQYTSGNKIKFRKSAYTNKQAQLFK